MILPGHSSCNVAGCVLCDTGGHTGDSNTVTTTPPTAATGWLCPKCGGGNAPWSARCPCTGEFTVTPHWGTTTWVAADG